MPTCSLCQKDAELQYSHIVPEFLYSELYNDKRQLMGISGAGAKGWKPLQKGLREDLFCEACEQHFNEKYEKPFKALWVDKCPLPDPWEGGSVDLKVDYTSFKLFHLCVFFRASVSSLATYKEISLGKHEDVIRKMLLASDPGRPAQYPVFGYGIVHHQTYKLVRIISEGERSMLDGNHCSGMLYGGGHWWVSVSSHPNKFFQQYGLQPDGSMTFTRHFWNEEPVIRKAAKLLPPLQ